MPRASKYPDVGQRIAANRIRRGLSQTLVSRRTGLDPSYLSRIETGKVHPTVRTAMKIAAAMQITPGELLGPSPPGRRERPCPVTPSGQCMMDLIDTGTGYGPDRERGVYTPRQLRMMRRFAKVVERGSPAILKALDVLLVEISRSDGRKRS